MLDSLVFPGRKRRVLPKGAGSQPLKSKKEPCPECGTPVKLKNMNSHRGDARKCPKWMNYRRG